MLYKNRRTTTWLLALFYYIADIVAFAICIITHAQNNDIVRHKSYNLFLFLWELGESKIVKISAQAERISSLNFIGFVLLNFFSLFAENLVYTLDNK